MEITHYNEELAFEVKSNKRGELVLKKPGDSFSIEVDLKSLPYGYGIDKKVMFISEDIKNIDLKLFKVSDVKFNRKNNKINISVLNELEQPIYVNYETSVQHNTPISDIVGIKEFHSLIKVSIYDKVYEYNNIIDLSDYIFPAKVEFLFNLKLVSEEEKEQLLSNYYSDVITNGPLASFYMVEKPNIDEFEQNEAIVPLSSTGTDSRDAGRFKVHFTSDQEANVAQYIANQFVEVESFFHNTLGYKKPQPSNMLASSYHIYLVTDLTNAWGVTMHFLNGSYINLDYDHCRDSFNADLDPSDNDYKITYSTIAHEYFHAVMNEYEFLCDYWIGESFANWASAVFLENNYDISTVKNTLIEKAKSFITNRQTLTSNDNAYEAYLFIYYLYYKFGYEFIKNVVVNLDSRGLQQIKDRLNDYTDDSFETLFEEFTVRNAYPSYYYRSGLFDDFHPDEDMEPICLTNFTYDDDINNLSSINLVYEKQDCDGYNVTVTIKPKQNTNFKINVIRTKQINGEIEYSNTRFDGSSYNSVSIPLEFANVEQTVIVLTNISSTELINFEYSVSYSHPTKRLYTGTTELQKHDHDDTMGYSFLPPSKGLYQIKVPSALYASDIMIVDNDPNLYSFNTIKKFQNIPYYQSNASNIRLADNFVIHLDNTILYYFLLNFKSESLNITITYLNSYETVDSNIGYSITKNTEKGDCLNQFFFPQSGRYEFELQYTDLPILKYTLLKMDANNNASIVGLSQISSTSSNTKFEYDIKEGTKIWLGYLDNYTDYTITLKITRKTGYHIRLIPDPKFVDRSLLGSEVNIRNGSLESNFITVGYTRTVYIHPDEADVSRLLYNWYSSNSNIARVSNFGTVTGISSGEATIRAILKSDPVIVGELQVVVISDTSTEARLVKLTTDKRESYPYAGSEVNSGKGYPEKNTIHIGYTRLLCFDNSDPTQLAPSSSIQDYTWVSSNSSIASVSSYGTITANGVGVVEIIGYYKYNSNFTAKIEITVVPN